MLHWDEELLATKVSELSAGSQIEILDPGGRTLRGEIGTAEVNGDELKVVFKWVARRNDNRWTTTDKLRHIFSLYLAIYAADSGNISRLCVSLITDHRIRFLPAGTEGWLNPKEVAGLTA